MQADCDHSEMIRGVNCDFSSRHSLGTHAFLSYARRGDLLFVRRLYADLISHGIKAWWDLKHMPKEPPDILAVLQEAIECAQHMILIVGPMTGKSMYVREEWSHALTLSKPITLVHQGENPQYLPEQLAHCKHISFPGAHSNKSSLNALLQELYP
jgi:hypothetical protein